MKVLSLTSTNLLLVFFIAACTNPKASEEGVKKLFEEQANDWITDGESTWVFENNDLVAKADSTGGFVVSKDTYKDFELTVDFYPDSIINSGVFVRCKTQEMGAVDCFEINIWDLHPNQEFRTGSIVQRVSPKEKINTIGNWNTYKVRCEGTNVKVWLNGVLTADIQNEDLGEGYIGLQAAGQGQIRFRNVCLKPIDKG